MSDYQQFVADKLVRLLPTGMEPTAEWPHLFDFQRDLTAWALRRGRAAIFSATGTGKSRVEVTWAHEVSLYTDKPTLILCPLAVAAQTAAEGTRIGITVTVCKSASDVRPGVNICNYEKLHLLDTSVFGGVAFDESSCVKHYNSKTLAQLMAAFSGTSFKLSATATPSPNDFTELGTQCELLGICSRVEMLSEYFVHDGGETQKWRLKGHAANDTKKEAV